ncbi:dihydrolipoamide acetyltransferase family protein [Nocardia acidivorans]|uniref:dihydrolipoamide acetyltransferase family protein n=1 Tax=Nocardia acidivorans TaxID=404580 RepID=UPI00082A3AD8|nr:dihydrolipoamide acetyltransferase family protein [Nocardia acidivorans]
MSRTLEFRLPDLGEGLTEAEIAAWTVAVGDHVDLNQPIVEVETEKAVVAIPSPFSGVVLEILVAPGERVPVGEPIIRIEDAAAEPESAPTVLVGYGPKPAGPRRRRPRPRPVDNAETPVVPMDSPSPAGEIRTPITGVRRSTAAAMVASHRTVPQVTEFVTVDATVTVELLETMRASPTFADLRPTALTLTAKAVATLLPDHPALNSSWDEQAGEIITRERVNLGIAVAAPRGLLVPVLADAHSRGITEICGAIATLAATARRGELTPADMRGATFTLSNIGVWGIDSGTPIVTAGQAAILCLGAIRQRPWVFRGELAVRWITTLALSFDHRLVDGEQGSRFLAALAGVLEDPHALLGRL